MLQVITQPFETSRYKGIDRIHILPLSYSLCHHCGNFQVEFYNNDFKLGEDTIIMTEEESEQWVEDGFLKTFVLQKLGAVEVVNDCIL